MGTYMRRTPAMLDVVAYLVGAPAEVWGLQISRGTGRPTGTVYPLLDRLEHERFVSSRWDDDAERPGPRRRLYGLTEQGREWAAALLRRDAGTNERNAP